MPLKSEFSGDLNRSLRAFAKDDLVAEIKSPILHGKLNSPLLFDDYLLLDLADNAFSALRTAVRTQAEEGQRRLVTRLEDHGAAIATEASRTGVESSDG